MIDSIPIRRLIGFAILVAACVTILTVILQHYQKKEFLKIDTMPFQGANGWGYEIKVGGKTFIRQDHIPAITGIHGFASKEDALKAATLVTAKIRQGRVPSVSSEELQQQGIKADFTSR